MDYLPVQASLTASYDRSCGSYEPRTEQNHIWECGGICGRGIMDADLRVVDYLALGTYANAITRSISSPNSRAVAFAPATAQPVRGWLMALAEL